MALQRIDEMSEPPVVGRFYLVPTVHYEYYRLVEAWPVIGPKHEDAEHFKFPWQHFHIDGRFLTVRQRRYIDRWGRSEGWAHSIGSSPLNIREPWGTVRPHPEPVWLRKKCLSARVEYPWGDQPAVRNLGSIHAADKLRCGPHGWICPHRGAHLGSIAPDADVPAARTAVALRHGSRRMTVIRLRNDPPELVRERLRVGGRWCKFKARTGGAFVDRVSMAGEIVVAQLSTGEIVAASSVEPAAANDR